jgi:cell filamentation protein
MMRRLFVEISDPSRTAAMRQAIDFFEGQGFPWNDRYLATTELTMAGVAGDHFMGRTRSKILIGNASDLPDPRPQRGETFTVVPSPGDDRPEDRTPSRGRGRGR